MENKLNKFLADLSVLSKKVQNYHWNISGKGFFSIHKQLDDVYENLNEQTDEIAERILAIGGRPLSTLSSYLELAEIKEGKNEKISISEAIENLIVDFEYMVKEAKEVKVMADESDDFGTSAMIDEFIINTEKLLWMLKESR